MARLKIKDIKTYEILPKGQIVRFQFGLPQIQIINKDDTGIIIELNGKDIDGLKSMHEEYLKDCKNPPNKLKNK